LSLINQKNPMKKISALITIALLLTNNLFAGGLLTSTSQSAQFVRMMSRSATIDIDAVYYNPAGLTQLKNGFYFGIYDQVIKQTRTIKSGSFLKYPEYEGKVDIPAFVTAFAVYKKNNWAFSFEFGPNAGGGSADFDHGLPSFEKNIARAVPSLSGLSALGYPVNAYDVDMSFKGTSVFWGIQVGTSYKINEILSVAAGVRLLPSINTYKGTISNIQLGPAGALQNGQEYLTGAAQIASLKAQQTSAAASSLRQLVSGGAGSYTLAQVQGAGYITADQRSQLEAGLIGLGLSAAQASAISVANAQTTYTGASTQLSATATTLNTTSAGLADKKVDTKQTGMGITPIVGFDIHLDKLNIGFKYEHKTTLTLTNSTTTDNTGMFPDGAETSSDIPGIISGGANYQITKKLKISASGSLFLDKQVNWGTNIYKEERTIDKNFLEMQFGMEYQLTDKFAVSAGYMKSNSGVSEQFQSDFNFCIDSYTIGTGFQLKLNKRLVLDAAISHSSYKDTPKAFSDPLLGNYTETYGKDGVTVAFGIGYKIF